MFFHLDYQEADRILTGLDCLVFGPKLRPGEGRFSDTDQIGYGRLSSLQELVWDRKSDWSAREIVSPQRQSLFYFTEEAMTEPAAEGDARPILLFLRSCDLAAFRALDQIYLHNGRPDPYYQALRSRLRPALLSCPETFENCFCRSLDQNPGEHALAGHFSRDGLIMQVNDPFFHSLGEGRAVLDFHWPRPGEGQAQEALELPEGDFGPAAAAHEMWREYDERCVACGRCNLVCPTCTCFSMQDIHYRDNPANGERRRVWASCMIDGFTDMAGGHAFRPKHGDRVRFRVLHKIYDFKKRYGFHMCVGCGRCSDVCPQYISFAGAVSKLAAARKRGEL